MLPRPLEELIEIAHRDDWHKILVGSDLRQILGEVGRLREQQRNHLKEAIEGWKGRIVRLDAMASEIANTPGAEPLLHPCSAAAQKIHELYGAMNELLRN